MNDATLTAMAVTWTIILSAGATLLVLRFIKWATLIRLTRRDRASERNVKRVKLATRWAALILVPAAIYAALVDMEEYWRDGRLGRELMWETRWESAKTERNRFRDISAFLARKLPNNMEEAARTLKREAGFGEGPLMTASEIEEIRNLIPYSYTKPFYHTTKPLDDTWREVGAHKNHDRRAQRQTNDYKIRPFFRMIDGDWRFVVRDTHIVVFLREGRNGNIDVAGTREWLSWRGQGALPRHPHLPKR